MTDKYELKLVWPHPEPNDVVVTGDFDQWKSSVHLKRTPTGFEGSISVSWETKVHYKFIVDGNWVTRDDQPKEVDPFGNVNNVAFIPAKPAVPDVPPPSAQPNGVVHVINEENQASPPVPPDVATVLPVSPPAEELQAKVEPAPKPVEIVPVVDSSADMNAAKSKADEVPSVTDSGFKEAPLPSTHTPAVKPEAKAEAQRPTTPPPATPVKDNGSSSVPSTPPPDATSASASAPATPASKQPFPRGGSEEAGSVHSLKEGARKKRLSFIDRLKSVFHHDHDGPETDGDKKEKKRSASFHRRSSSKAEASK